MALAYDGAIQRLIDAFANLPGIGPKGAQRIAFYLLNVPDEESQALIDAITEVKEKVRFCDICGNVCETSPCPVCVDPRRDHSVICVVEEPKDVMSIERTREYRGMYHVLGGVISPILANMALDGMQQVLSDHFDLSVKGEVSAFVHNKSKVNLVRYADDFIVTAATKEIAEEVKKQMDLTIDKKKVQLKEAIRTLGTHNVPVKLHPKVTAELKVVVKEEA